MVQDLMKRMVCIELLDMQLRQIKLHIFGDVNTRREYIHVKDAAKASAECLNKFNNKTINITGNETLKITDLLEIIREILGIKLKIKLLIKNKKVITLWFHIISMMIL